MPRRGENIYRRKDGRWEGRSITGHAENGHATFRYFYGHSYREVKEKLRNQNQQKQPPVQPRLHYGDILNAWLQSKRLSVKESSYGKYRHTVDCYIRPHLDGCRACDLTTELVADYVQDLLQNGRRDGQGLAPKTVQDILVIVKDTVSFAADQGIRLPCRLEKMAVKQKTPKMRVFTREEQRKLTTFLLDSPDTYKFAVLLCLYTGLRIGEVCALRWCCIDMGRQVLRVQATAQRVRDPEPGGGPKTKMLFADPKSKCSIRDIPLPEQMLPLMKKFRGSPNDFILSDSADQCPDPRALQYRFKRYLSLCGIEDANFHALRHTFATRCVENGFELKSLSEILGHANVNITLNRYVHSSFVLKKENMDRMALLL